MDANLSRTEQQTFEIFEVVDKPKKDHYGKYDGILKAMSNLDNEKALKLSFLECGFTLKSARNMICSLRAFANRKYGYRIGGIVQNDNLYLWRNPSQQKGHFPVR